MIIEDQHWWCQLSPWQLNLTPNRHHDGRTILVHFLSVIIFHIFECFLDALGWSAF